MRRPFPQFPQRYIQLAKAYDDDINKLHRTIRKLQKHKELLISILMKTDWTKENNCHTKETMENFLNKQVDYYGGDLAAPSLSPTYYGDDDVVFVNAFEHGDDGCRSLDNSPISHEDADSEVAELNHTGCCTLTPPSQKTRTPKTSSPIIPSCLQKQQHQEPNHNSVHRHDGAKAINHQDDELQGRKDSSQVENHSMNPPALEQLNRIENDISLIKNHEQSDIQIDESLKRLSENRPDQQSHHQMSVVDALMPLRCRRKEDRKTLLQGTKCKCCEDYWRTRPKEDLIKSGKHRVYGKPLKECNRYNHNNNDESSYFWSIGSPNISIEPEQMVTKAQRPRRKRNLNVGSQSKQLEICTDDTIKENPKSNENKTPSP